MRARVNDEEEKGIRRDGGDDRVPALEFDHCSDERTACRRLAHCFNGGGDGWGQSRQVFAVEVAVGSRVNEETITPENNHSLDAFALREGPNEVVYCGQCQLRVWSSEA